MHPSGRVLPVGIAQPIQSYEHDPRQTTEWDSTKPSWRETGGEGGKMEPLQTKGCHRSTSSSVDIDDEADVQKVVSELDSDSSDSESDSSSDDGSGMEPSQQQSMKQQYGNETIAQPVKAKGGALSRVTRTPSTASFSGIPAPTRPSLPAGKKLHVFLSHSTGDQLAVKGSIVVPLRESHAMQVVACYHCMEGKHYNDKHIEQAMGESCVIVVALSPSYVDSQRYIHMCVHLMVSPTTCLWCVSCDQLYLSVKVPT